MSQNPPSSGGPDGAEQEQHRPAEATSDSSAQDASLPAAQKDHLDNNDKELATEGKPSGKTLIARYGLMRHIGQFRHSLEQDPKVGTMLVLRTERGVELGKTLASVSQETSFAHVSQEALHNFIEASGEEYPFRKGGRVLREANTQDVIDYRHLRGSAGEEGAFCRRQIQELALDMKLISVEHLLGGERIIFNFAAETRVDFRELVRRLAKEYRTRIEMRQVGARDEARLLADYERCGQRCCCQQFLKYLKPVSMRMAKVQKATLDPSKISGRCGRLMCCLRYEDATYGELRAMLPKKKTWVRTDGYFGRVIDSQPLTQLVQLELVDHTKAVVPNEAIIQRNLPEPTQDQIAQLTIEARSAAVERQRRLETNQQSEEASHEASRGTGSPRESENQRSATPQAGKSGKKKRRRRRRPGKKPAGQNKEQQEKPKASQTQAGKPQGQGKADTKKPKRRRRRRRKKKPSS